MKKDDLHTLIHALSKNEKRYVKLDLQQNLRKGKSNLLELYDNLLNQKFYNENDLTRDLTNSSNLKYLAVVKQQLKKFILKSLRSYNENLNAKWRIQKYKQNCDLLIGKRLHKLALKEIAKAIKIAKDHEYNLTLCDLEEIKLDCYNNIQDEKKFSISIEDTYQNIFSNIKLSIDFFESKKVFNLVTNLWSTNGTPRTEEEKLQFKKLIKIDSFKSKTNLRSEKYFIERTKETYMFLLGDYESAYQSSKIALKILLDNPHEKLNSPKQHLKSIYILLKNCYLTNRLNLIEKHINEFKNIKTEEFSDRIYQIEQYYNILFNLFFQEKLYDLKKLIKEVKNFEKLNEVYEIHFTIETKMLLYSQCASIYIFNNEYKKGKKWNNKVLDMGQKNLRPDIYAACLIKDIIIDYEFNKSDLLLYKIENIKKALKRRSKLYPAELLLINGFYKLIEGKTKLNNDHIVKFIISLEEIYQSKENHYSLYQFNYIKYFKNKFKAELIKYNK